MNTLPIRYIEDDPFDGGDVTLDADALYWLINGAEEAISFIDDIVKRNEKRAARGRKVLGGKATPRTWTEENSPELVREWADDDERTAKIGKHKIAVLKRAIAAAKEALEHMDDEETQAEAYVNTIIDRIDGGRKSTADVYEDDRRVAEAFDVAIQEARETPDLDDATRAEALDILTDLRAQFGGDEEVES
jgi:hypothetical protein